ncbi:putative 2,3-bisphosphoglycerate-independent phosphoglycerate mutase [Tanacetum coccineum]|uniref:2,3-bisphosphoglycerate-independent phosphoglycerate mutase n=1 Tax=Tanacetum coccineum TaxID=301880 RepID=A0ABQ5H271_9ASTR
MVDSKMQPHKRVAFVLIDGLGDVSIPRFGYKTPLEAAKVPNLDAIASAGVNGLMDPVEVGLGCGSDTAHLSIMGYDPRVYYRGRGAFESMGAGLAMAPGDIAFKLYLEKLAVNFLLDGNLWLDILTPFHENFKV